MTELPLALVAPIRVSQGTGNGFFLSHRKSEPPFLVWESEGKPFILRLEGDEHRFHFYPLTPGYKANGTLISDIEIIVELESRYDATSESDPLGALVLQDGTVSIVAIRAGDTFGDPLAFPLWGGFQNGTKDEKVGFARWSIVARNGEERIRLWPNVDGDKSQEQ